MTSWFFSFKLFFLSLAVQMIFFSIKTDLVVLVIS